MSVAPEDLVPVHTTLPDGTPAIVRPVTPEDGPMLVDGFERLSPESRFRRFLGTVSELTPEQVRYLTDVDGEQHIAWGVTVPASETGEQLGVAIARCVRSTEEPDVAELAIAVKDEWQGRGVGTLLARVMARRAWNVGVRYFDGLMLVSNDGAFHLMEHLGAIVHRHVDAPGVLSVRWALFEPEKAAGASPG